MATMNEIDLEHPFTMLKGEIGLRKSTSALSWPGPQYWFSVDKKMESIAIPMYNWKIDPKTINYDNYFDYIGIKAKIHKLKVNCPYKTIIMDSITSIGDVTNKQTLGEKAKEGEGKIIAGIRVNSIEDFNAETTVFSEIMSDLEEIRLRFRVNIILIAHVIQTDYKSLDNKVTHVARSIVTGGKKAAARIPVYCTEVYHFNIETGLNASVGGRYAVMTRHGGDDFARTALPLEDKIIFHDEPLYGKYIQPAIEKLKARKLQAETK